MNWKEIEKKHSKAWELLDSWKYEGLDIDCMQWVDKHGCSEDTFNIRDLYDFFDEQGIYVSVLKIVNKAGFWFTIRQIPESVYDIHSGYDLSLYFNLRKEAEQAAFLKAFEILEEKL